MSEEVKKEGDFKLKSKPKKPKNLGKTNDEPIKVDLTKPEAQGEVIPEITKVDLTKKEEDAVQERKTEEVSVGSTPGDSEKVDEQVRVINPDEQSDKDVEKTSPLQEITDEEPVKKENKTEIVEEQPSIDLPENIEKLVKFMKETGGTLEDYVRLNADYSNVDADVLLREYYKRTKPHLNDDEISFVMQENFDFDEEVDEERDIRKKKLAKKEAVAEAQSHLDKLKQEYYDQISLRSGVTQEQKKALDFFNRYNDEQKMAEQKHEAFLSNTKQLFSNEFKGFDYKVGDKKFRYAVKNPDTIADKQSNLNNFIGKYLDKDGNVQDTSGYHKAIFSAMNADQLATHFYEQGKADGVKEVIDSSKNPSTDAPRQVASGDVFIGGFKVRSISGADSTKLRIKKRKFN